jgi:dCMP deaminase
MQDQSTQSPVQIVRAWASHIAATDYANNRWGATVTRATWDEWFLGLAQYISTRSKDPSTQVGAVIVRDDKTIASTGYNGFSRYTQDAPGLLGNREEKLKRIIHAEMNALMFAREPLQGYSLYTYPFEPCERCAVCVIQAGIVKVVAPNPTPEQLERWGDSFKLSRALFSEANVEVTLI